MIIDEEDDDSSNRWTEQEQDAPGDLWNYIDDQIPDVCSDAWPVPSVSNLSVAEEVIIMNSASDGDSPDLSNADYK